MLKKELQELGLTDNESKIYLALLEHGNLNPTDLAHKTGLHRSYLYDSLERAREKGIVNVIRINNKKCYQAVHPKTLRELLVLKVKQLDNLLPDLTKIFNEQKEDLRVELHKGKAAFRTCIKDILSNLKKNQTLHLLQIDETLTEDLNPVLLKQYFRVLKEKNVKEKVLIREGSNKLDEPSVIYRELPAKDLGNVIYTISDKKVYLFLIGTPNYLIIIDNKEIARSYLKQFKVFWELAGKK